MYEIACAIVTLLNNMPYCMQFKYVPSVTPIKIWSNSNIPFYFFIHSYFIADCSVLWTYLPFPLFLVLIHIWQGMNKNWKVIFNSHIQKLVDLLYFNYSSSEQAAQIFINIYIILAHGCTICIFFSALVWRKKSNFKLN